MLPTSSAPAPTLTFHLWPALGSMLLAWDVVLALHFGYQIFFSGWGRATDVAATVYYSGVFVVLSAFTVVPLVTWLFGRLGLPLWVFPIVAAATGVLTLWLLLLPFRSPALGLFSLNFSLLALVIGLFFGIFYLRLNGFGFRPAGPGLLLALGLAAWWAGRAALIQWPPVWSYQHLGRSAQQELIYDAISKLGIDSPIRQLNELLPGFVPPNLPATGQLSHEEPGLSYEIRFVNGRVTGMSAGR